VIGGVIVSTSIDGVTVITGHHEKCKIKILHDGLKFLSREFLKI
jgi:hypothetical protein